MAGRQIRWASLGRVAAIAAAVLAAIVSVPALLGGERPPPVPADVGLVPPAAEPATLPPQAPAEPTQAQRKTGWGKGEHAPRRPGLQHRLARRGGDQGGRGHHVRRHRPRERQNRDGGAKRTARTPAPTATYVPAPVYSPPVPGEFRFER